MELTRVKAFVPHREGAVVQSAELIWILVMRFAVRPDWLIRAHSITARFHFSSKKERSVIEMFDMGGWGVGGCDEMIHCLLASN